MCHNVPFTRYPMYHIMILLTIYPRDNYGLYEDGNHQAIFGPVETYPFFQKITALQKDFALADLLFDSGAVINKSLLNIPCFCQPFTHDLLQLATINGKSYKYEAIVLDAVKSCKICIT